MKLAQQAHENTIANGTGITAGPSKSGITKANIFSERKSRRC